MKKIAIVLLTLAFLTPSARPAAAQEEPGVVARVTLWAVNDSGKFEAGLKAHNELHRAHQDPSAVHTWSVISGPRTGEYLRGSFGHHWQDFDRESKMAEADSADSAMHLVPYVTDLEVATYRFIPELSSPLEPVKPLSRIRTFELKFGHRTAFEGAVKKISEAMMKRADSRPAYWYELVEGGRGPTYVVSMPRDNWAGFAPREKSLVETVNETYGEEAGAIWEALTDAVVSESSYSIAYRPDLSYLPEADKTAE